MKNSSDITHEFRQLQAPRKPLPRSNGQRNHSGNVRKEAIVTVGAVADAIVSRARSAVCASPEVHISAVRRARSVLPSPRELERTIALFHVLANETRLRIVLALRDAQETANGALCVCDLAEISGASESMTSHQLRLLRDADIVSYRRAGKLALYRLKEGPLSHLLADAVEYVSTR